MTFVSWLLAAVGSVAVVGADDSTSLGLLAATMAVLATMLVLRRFVSRPRGIFAVDRCLGVRARAERTAVVAQRDPDAAGHCRPRAPGRAPTAARSIALAA